MIKVKGNLYTSLPLYLIVVGIRTQDLAVLCRDRSGNRKFDIVYIREFSRWPINRSGLEEVRVIVIHLNSPVNLLSLEEFRVIENRIIKKSLLVKSFLK